MRIKVFWRKLIENKYRAQLILLFFIALTVAARRIISGGDMWHSDASRHVMNGVFIMDLLKDMPLRDLYDYSVKYYARYPALSMPFHPPFFPLVQAIFYLTFGVSLDIARLLISAFALLAVMIWYKLASSIYDRETAFYSSVFMISTPGFALWSNEVMLELPALALIILSVYFFHKYFELNQKRCCLYLLLSLAAAAMAKQTALFVLPLFFSYILLRGLHRKLIEREVILSAGTLLLLLMFLLALTYEYSKEAINHVLASTEHWYGYPRLSRQNLLLYIKRVPWVMGWPITILAAAYIPACLLKRAYRKDLMFLMWALWWYAMFSFFAAKDTRYLSFCIPPLCLFAVLALRGIRLQFKGIRLAPAALVIMSLFNLSMSYMKPIGYISGYEEAAKYVVEEAGAPTVVAFSGYHNGNFIFHVRKLDTNRNIVVLRGDKIFSDHEWVAMHRDLAGQQLLRFLRDFGVKYVVLETKERKDSPDIALLLKLLPAGDFILRKEIKLKTNIRAFEGVSLQVYQYCKEPLFSRETIDFRLRGLGDVSVPIQSLIQESKDVAKRSGARNRNSE